VDDALRITDPIAKKRLIDRLARIGGQIRGLHEMVEREEPCEHIAQQVGAARQALSKVFAELISDELSAVEQSSGKVSPETHARLASLVKILSKYA
jgi:CsoR family transcriptional regulator, copper-sensing transcriptional repressor